MKNPTLSQKSLKEEIPEERPLSTKKDKTISDIENIATSKSKYTIQDTETYPNELNKSKMNRNKTDFIQMNKEQEKTEQLHPMRPHYK